MTRFLVLFSILAAIGRESIAQNIFTALHLNEEREYKTRKPAAITETNTFYTSQGKRTEKIFKRFNYAGMLALEERFDEQGKLEERLVYETDTLSRRVLKRVFERWGPGGHSYQTAYYTYDTTGFLTGITDKNFQGALLYQTDIIVNEKGLPIELVVTDANGNAFGKETADYLDERNLAVTSVYSNAGEKVSTDTIKISFAKAHEFAEDGTRYNEYGDLTQSIIKNVAGLPIRYEYENIYDSYGNLTEQKIFTVDTKKGRIKRKIDRIFRKAYTYQ